MKTEPVKGFNDYSGEEARKRAEIKKILVEIFEEYGFEPAETPLIEYEEFVKGENSNDEAVSDIFRLKDKGKRNLALRYEFTFQLKRLMKNKKLPYRRYQIGPVFRDEPVSSNRFRQITQGDIDVVGSTIKEEAEILSIAKKALDKLGFKFKIYFNNRKLLNEILDEQGIKNKEKVIKEIDKLDKLSEKDVRNNLKKIKAENIFKIFKEKEDYFKRYKSYAEIEELKKYCKYYNIDIVFSPSLARGLSYYNGTIFEIKTEGTRESICAGGSYIFDKVQCTGISFGLDRLTKVSKIKPEEETIMVLSINKDQEAIKIAEKLRQEGKKVVIYYGKPSKALQYTNSYNIKKVIFIGGKETEKGVLRIKDMKTGKEISRKDYK
ncbi:MAG: histidine--tRNA ligase family protein [Nanoarchaeota archaeon]|nr:histidine--tRNA ligase family protein [Nanoarchaeota archaeon]